MLLYHAHNPLTDRPTRSAFKVFTPHACIFVSDAIRQRALKWIPWLSNTYVVHNGADDAVFYPASPETRPKNPIPVVLFVGRLVPVKGVHVLMEAMRILQERKVKILCRIVGSSFLHGSKVTPYVRDLLDKSCRTLNSRVFAHTLTLPINIVQPICYAARLSGKNRLAM